MKLLKDSLSHYDWRLLMRRHFIAVLIFLIMSWVFMGRSLSSCQGTILGDLGGGDHLSGIIWLNTFTGAPFGGITHATNFPYGQSVAQPQLITSAVHMVPTWAISKLVGPYCGWNLMVLGGYMLSALVMYGFIYWLIRHRGLAVFAGLAVSFTPYHYFKSFGHLSYIQSELFIGILWAFIWFWRNPTPKKGLVLGVLSALLFYSDGYFPFIGGVMLASMTLYGLTINYLKPSNRKVFKLTPHIRSLLVTGLTMFVLLLPIAAVQIKYGERIQASLTSSRSDTISELKSYGARHVDYLLPSENHPIPAIREFVRNYRADNPHSNKGEYTLYLGAVTLSLALYGLFAIFVSKKHKREKEYRSHRWVAGCLLTIAAFGFLISLVPTVELLGRSTPMPSYVLGRLIELWRVYARLYLIVNIAVVGLGVIGLWYLRLKVKNRVPRAIVLTALIALSVIDLMPFNPLRRADQVSLDKSYHTYLWLRHNNSINAMAAYPLLEHPFGTSYFGDQVIYNKPILNNGSSNDPELLLHRAVTGLGDGQTLGVLRSLGINNLLLYRLHYDRENNYLTHVYGDYGARVASIKDTVAPLGHALIPDAGFDRPSIDPVTQISCRKSIAAAASLGLRRLKDTAPTEVKIHFELKGQPGQGMVVHSQSKLLATEVFTTPNEVRSIDLTVNDGEVITAYTFTPPNAGSPEVCNLTTF